MKYLVSGGAGFVGSYLVEELLNQGHKVIVVDDLSNGNESNLKPSPNLEIKIANVVNVKIDDKIDGVFHLATVPRSFSLDDPINDIEINCKGMINMLELSRKCPGNVHEMSGKCSGNVLETASRQAKPAWPTSPGHHAVV